MPYWLQKECCAGLHAMMALRAGAEHVTAVDRWLYMALACKESLVRAQFRLRVSVLKDVLPTCM